MHAFASHQQTKS